MTQTCRLVGLPTVALSDTLQPSPETAQPRVISLRLIFSHMGHGHRHPRLGDFSRDIDARRRAPLLRPHLAAVGLAVALPHRVGLVPSAITQPPLTQRLTKSRRECPSCDTSPNFQAQTALEFAGAGYRALPPSG